MGNNDVVGIRVEALGVSITIADGSIAIEQTKTEIPAVRTVPKVERSAAVTRETIPTRTVIPEHVPVLLRGVDDSTIQGDSGATTPVIDELEQTPERPSSPSRNGTAGLPSDSGKDQGTQTKPLRSDKEVEKLRALYPTHSASAIAEQLGRGRNSVRSKAQNLGERTGRRR